MLLRLLLQLQEVLLLRLLLEEQLLLSCSGSGRRRSLSTSGRGSWAPDARRPRVTRTLVPSASQRHATRTGQPFTGSTSCTFE